MGVERAEREVETVPWEEVMELFPEEARTEYEDLIYLNFDIIEGCLDIAKAITEYEKGGFVCGAVAPEKVNSKVEGDFLVIHYYDFVPCRNVSSSPKSSYRADTVCRERVKESYRASATLHTHDYNAPPSVRDLLMAPSITCFLVTPDYFIAYNGKYPFTVISDTGKRVRSKHLEVLKHYNMSKDLSYYRARLTSRSLEKVQILIEPYEYIV